MKKLFPILALFLGAMAVSCTGDVEPLDPAVLNPAPVDPSDPTNPTNPTTGGTFKVDFNGQTYTALTTVAYNSGGKITIGAINSAGGAFNLIIDGTTAGTYSLADVNSESSIYYVPSGSEYGYASFPLDDQMPEGNIVVTNIDTVNHKISGTFQFKGFWSNDDPPVANMNFTNGTFTNLTYVTQNPTGQTFTATINGAAFNGVDIIGASGSSGTSEFINVQGESTDGRVVNVYVDSALPVGSYNFTYTPTAQVGFEYAFSSTDFGTHATTGTVTVTAKTADHITGTFSGTVVIDTTTYQFTNGAFSVDY